jgi:chemotaxis protein CheD
MNPFAGEARRIDHNILAFNASRSRSGPPVFGVPGRIRHSVSGRALRVDSMKSIIADHRHNPFLKPGEVIISPDPILVSTVLGSCVAVTMFCPETGVGAICHAMLPVNLKQDDNFLYVDTAIRHLHSKMLQHAGDCELVIKLFGGAQVLTGAHGGGFKQSVGEQNIYQATRTLEQLDLIIAKSDIGGNVGRKLFFSMKTGDVYLRKLKLGSLKCACVQGGRP